MRPAYEIPAARQPEARAPAGWRNAMALCHLLMGATLLAAGIYMLVRLQAFDLF